MGEALVVDRETGEMIPYMDISRQHELAAKYDEACRSLIGPNDIQREGGREFKKKSAWRKLARYFGISTTIEGQPSIATIGENTVVTVTVRAAAPWGQHATAMGACGSDEEKGRRVITLADMIATAQTRATNRAVSDLVAMGEVSAEEIQRSDGSTRQTYGDAHEGVVTLPGKPEKWEGNGGKPLTEVPVNVLEAARRFFTNKNEGGKNDAIIASINDELDNRREQE